MIFNILSNAMLSKPSFCFRRLCLASATTFLCFSSLSLEAYINFEEHPQEFVLETKRIYLSDYPDAFNPSIIRWKGKLLLSFRNVENPKNSYNTSQIGLVWIDENFNPISKPQIVQIDQTGTLSYQRAEDARLIECNGRLLMIYSDNEDPLITKGGFRVYISELSEKNGLFTISHKEKLENFENNNKSLREKNWTPFVYKNSLFLSYSLNPHLVFKPIPQSKSCETFAWTNQSITWNWGELRGGTQASLVNGNYLTFFHTCLSMASEHSQGKEMLHYFMGACTFENTPPFAMKQISPEPIIGKGFFSGQIYKPYWGSWRGIFPCGYIFDDNFIWIAYGRQNHEIWIVKLDRKAFFESLISVCQ